MKAVIIYEDAALAAEVNARLERSAYQTDTAMEWSVKPWRMDLLKGSPAMGEALAEAADADLIVLAVRPGEALPSWLSAWLERWAGSRRVQDAALALFSGGNEESGSVPVTSVVSQFAQRHGLSLILDASGPLQANSASLLHGLHQRQVEQTPTLRRILEQPPHGRHRNSEINE